MNNRYRHLFFDLDRTLWDYDSNAMEALQEIYNSYKLEGVFDEFENFHCSFTKHNDELWKEFRLGKVHKDVLRTLRFEKTLFDYGTINSDLAIELNNHFLEISPRKTRLIDGAIDLLEYLRSKPYSLYIITNGFTKIQLLKMESSGLDVYFKKVFTSENTSSSKPHNDIFRQAVTSVNARKNESLMIGDDLETDITGARNYGIDQVFFNPLIVSHNHKTTFEITKLDQLREIL